MLNAVLLTLLLNLICNIQLVTLIICDNFFKTYSEGKLLFFLKVFFWEGKMKKNAKACAILFVVTKCIKSKSGYIYYYYYYYYYCTFFFFRLLAINRHQPTRSATASLTYHANHAITLLSVCDNTRSRAASYEKWYKYLTQNFEFIKLGYFKCSSVIFIRNVPSSPPQTICKECAVMKQGKD